MIVAEFEEKTYEWPLYNQIERAQTFVYTPGQVLESTIGFDAGVATTNLVLWQTLGYSSPPPGTVLSGLSWPLGFGPRNPKSQLPDARLNLFLQAKRPVHYSRRPRSLKKLQGVGAPLWSFKITPHQQHVLEVLAEMTQGTAHVTYASAAFHTNSDLFKHMKLGTIVENSTFPSVAALKGHEAWYYWSPGAFGAANLEPTNIEDAPLIDRLRRLARESTSYEYGDLSWLATTAQQVLEAARASEGPLEAVGARFFDDLLTLNRLAEQYQLRLDLLAYAQIGLFTTRFDLQWLVVTAE